MDDIRARFRVPDRRDYLGPMSAPPPKPVQQTAKLPRPVERPKPQTRPIMSAGPIPQREPSRPMPTSRKSTRKKGRKLFVVPLILLLLAGAGVGGWVFLKPLKSSNSSEQEKPQTAGASTSGQQGPVSKAGLPLKEGTIRLVATGNFAAYDSVNDAAKQGSGYDYAPLMNDLKPVFANSDINICHQETIGAGIDEGLSGYPYFNAPTEWSKALLDTGCNVVNMASFHTYDKSQRAIEKAVSFYDDKEGLFAQVGANRNQKEQDEIRYFEVENLKFAMLAYTTKSQKKPAESYGVNVYSESLAKKQVSQAKETADFVIVGMTWGKEDTEAVQPQQESIAKTLAAAGADLIIGNGPHVLQTADILEGKDKGSKSLVFYSLGNAVNSQLPTKNLIGGLAVINIDIRTQDMVDPGILPVYQHYEWSAAEKASNNFDARRNFNLYILDQAAEALAKSQNNTTVEAQTKRIKSLLTQNVPILVLTSKDLE
jgi:poly-gamma-glutamate capsule biosynthesis protein CapA/YwtB (metallophosphatase superfamily)